MVNERCAKINSNSVKMFSFNSFCDMTVTVMVKCVHGMVFRMVKSFLEILKTKKPLMSFCGVTQCCHICDYGALVWQMCIWLYKSSLNVDHGWWRRIKKDITSLCSPGNNLLVSNHYMFHCVVVSVCSVRSSTDLFGCIQAGVIILFMCVMTNFSLHGYSC